MRKYSHKKWPNNFSGKFRKFGQKSFATPQICLLLHLWLQSHRPQKLEVKIIVSLVSVHCHAYGFGFLLYGWRFVQYGEPNCESTLMQLWKCFTVSPLRSAYLAIHQTAMKTKGQQLQRAYKTRWLSRKATARARSEILAVGPQWSNFVTCPIVNETAYFVSCTSAIPSIISQCKTCITCVSSFAERKQYFYVALGCTAKALTTQSIVLEQVRRLPFLNTVLTKNHTRTQYKQIKIQLDV